MWLYVILFAVMVVEGIGVPFFPGEAVLYLAVTKAAKTGGSMVPILATSVMGNLVGAFALFYLISRVGSKAAMRVSKRLGLTEESWAKFDRWMERFGPFAVIFARLSGPLRPVATLAAGLARMEPWRFLVLYVLGALFYNSLIIQFLQQATERPWLWMVALAIGLGNGLLLWHRRRRQVWR